MRLDVTRAPDVQHNLLIKALSIELHFTVGMAEAKNAETTTDTKPQRIATRHPTPIHSSLSFIGQVWSAGPGSQH
jgi:hypothetical protein